MPPMIYVPPIDGQRRSSSMRDKAGRNLPTSPLAAGILRQQSVATPTGNFVHRTVIPHVTSSVAGACLMDPSADGAACESFEAAGIRHVGAKCKPRLTRQIAVQDDLAGNNLQCPPSSGYNKCVSFNTANVMVLPSSKDDQQRQHYCPLHSPRSLQGVWESSIEEDYEDVAEEPKRNRSAIDKDKIFSAVASIYTNRDKNRLGLSGFIPRKLSTISSRSCSINPDNEAATDETFEIIDESQPSGQAAAAATALLTQQPSVSASVKSSQVDPAASRAFKSSNELLNVYATKRHKSKEAELSKSDHDLYQHKMSHPPKSSQRKSIGSSIVRLIVTPENSSSSASSSARLVEETRFGADDTVLVHPRPDAVQSPDSGSVINQKELDDDDDDSSHHEQEMDPLMQ